jgi:hypothetical protein
MQTQNYLIDMPNGAIVTARRIFQQTRVFIIILLMAFHQQRSERHRDLCF